LNQQMAAGVGGQIGPFVDFPEIFHVAVHVACNQQLGCRGWQAHQAAMPAGCRAKQSGGMPQESEYFAWIGHDLAFNRSIHRFRGKRGLLL